MTPPTNPPVWTDGEPANLEAAATDAYEWLVWFRTHLPDAFPAWRHSRHDEHRARLGRCIRALRAHLGSEAR